ncbi:MAG: precorrin-6A synthase (deacetylating) [Paracoccus sp. (in: a-proteobacteria)]|nr:precorrin-6A synthase (deacetylating) [Paracoccus sp. (in: a-proteobacteria)]
MSARLNLIGIGSGNPAHLTLAAIDTLNRADLILVPRKEDKPALADLRREILARHLKAPAKIVEFDLPKRGGDGDYLADVALWHDAIAARWAELIAAHLPKGGEVALLVWGDPSLYDSSLRIAARLGLKARVEPGITSLQVLTAAHCVPLNGLGGAVWLTTGRRLRADGWPAGAESVAVMLDAGGAFQSVDPAGVTIWWGGCLGMAEQRLVSGKLSLASAEIIEARRALKAQLGWVMDIYLMRRETP